MKRRKKAHLLKKQRVEKSLFSVGVRSMISPNAEEEVPVDFAEDVLRLNEANSIAIEYVGYTPEEYNGKARIRIDAVATTGWESFAEMMDALVKYAVRCGYRRIVFEGYLEDELLEMFRDYGFDEYAFSNDRNSHMILVI